MKLQSNPQWKTPVDPFGVLGQKGAQPSGPGVGVPRDGKNIPYPGAATTGRRRRVGGQVLGDTPPRDGPFAASAAPIATQFPPKTRSSDKRKISGANPFK